MSDAPNHGIVWEKVLEPGDLPEGRVRPVTCHLATVCMTHFPLPSAGRFVRKGEMFRFDYDGEVW